MLVKLYHLMKKKLFSSRGLKKTLQNMSSVAVRWFVLETADRKAKTTCAKGNISPKPSSQRLASMAKIFVSGPFQKQSFSLAMSQLEMVVYARETWLALSELRRTSSSQNYSISVVLMFFQNCYISGPSGRFQLCSLLFWTKSGFCV